VKMSTPTRHTFMVPSIFSFEFDFCTTLHGRASPCWSSSTNESESLAVRTWAALEGRFGGGGTDEDGVAYSHDPSAFRF
jgi:hypothetical protein